MVTGTIFKGLTFDGVDSTQYGVYITGEAVYNAPMRDVEMIEIPGRNGAYALDKGRFTNIEVTYPAGIYGKDESEFAQAISDFRNALCSRKGYCRLTDGYNSSEYRMAVYSSGLEVSPALLKAGQFDITFNCKPQRFLTSGETQSNVTSGGTITNPTLFESHPLLFVDGYGDFDINGESITIKQGAVMGKTLVATTDTQSHNITSTGAGYVLNKTTNLSTISLVGDLISTGTETADVWLEAPAGYTIEDITDINITDGTIATLYDMGWESEYFRVACWIDGSTFTKGTSKTITDTASVSFTMVSTGIISNEVWVFNITISYDGNNSFVYNLGVNKGTGTSPILWPADSTAYRWGSSLNDMYVQSTKSALGQLYIDLDIGECYRIENGEYISINTATTLPADLPTLKPGANVITYDNSFTTFKITPRWWKV